jgi:hypothetical protein
VIHFALFSAGERPGEAKIGNWRTFRSTVVKMIAISHTKRPPEHRFAHEIVIFASKFITSV